MQRAPMRVARLVREVKEGRTEAFRELFELFYEKAFRAAYYIVEDVPTAEDIAQDAFIEAYQKIDQVRDVQKFGAWLASIATNRGLDHHRKHRRTVEMADVEDLESVSAMLWGDLQLLSPPVEDLVEDRETRREVRRVIRNLRPQHKQVIILFYYYDLKVREIADMLEVRPGTIKSRLHRARAAIRQTMKRVATASDADFGDARPSAVGR